MTRDRLQSLVDREDGLALRYAGGLRRGGSVGIADDRLLIVRDSDERPVSVPFENVDEVELADLDWFLVVLSVVLVGFGALSTSRSLLGGIGLAAAGAISLYVTYRKRNRATVRTHSRSKPLEFYPTDPDGFYEALGRELDAYRARVGEADGEEPGTDG